MIGSLPIAAMLIVKLQQPLNIRLAPLNGSN